MVLSPDKTRLLTEDCVDYINRLDFTKSQVKEIAEFFAELAELMV
jgi:hypothetical protein